MRQEAGMGAVGSAESAEQGSRVGRWSEEERSARVQVVELRKLMQEVESAPPSLPPSSFSLSPSPFPPLLLRAPAGEASCIASVVFLGDLERGEGGGGGGGGGGGRVYLESEDLMEVCDGTWLCTCASVLTRTHAHTHTHTHTHTHSHTHTRTHAHTHAHTASCPTQARPRRKRKGDCAAGVRHVSFAHGSSREGAHGPS